MTVPIYSPGEPADNQTVGTENKISPNHILPSRACFDKNTLYWNNSILISDAIRRYGDAALDLIEFKNCNPIVREVVTIVTEYMQ